MVFIIIELIIIIGSVWYLAFAVESLVNMRPGRIIYHGSDLEEQGEHLLAIIKKYVPHTEQYALVEPGAGLAKVTDFLQRRFSWRETLAIDIGPIVMSWAKVRSFFRASHIRFLRRDIFEVSFPKPAVIYCYLTSEILDRMYTQGQLKGALVITLTFPITDVPITETIPLKSWQKELLVYDFRKA